ncbi:MAG TPA: hypothetical protein VHO47_03050 [Candidatus Babeliales bacterium]|nr:hypothetical protein [Candidatus Babeliales bacterium]
MKKMRMYLALTVFSVLFISNNSAAQISACAVDKEHSTFDSEPGRILPVPATLIAALLEKLLSNSTIVQLLLGLSEKALEKLIEDLINHAQSQVDCPPTAPVEETPASFFHSLHNQIAADLGQK